MCRCDKINENRTCEQAEFGHMKNNLVEQFDDTTKLRDSMGKCTSHYVVIIVELIVLPKNNSACPRSCCGPVNSSNIEGSQCQLH